MAQWLKVSAAFTFRLGPFVDSTDGVTAETALTLAQADFRLSKAGGAFASKNETTSGAHDENGYYTCILNTTDTNTLGTLDINVSEAGALPVFKSFMVVPAQVWDSYFGADVLQVHAVEISNDLITAAAIAADAIGSSELAAGAANEIADALLDRAAGVETGLTPRQALRLIASALFSKASGMATTTAVFRDVGDTKDRITATVDADGNRTALTLDAT